MNFKKPISRLLLLGGLLFSLASTAFGQGVPWSAPGGTYGLRDGYVIPSWTAQGELPARTYAVVWVGNNIYGDPLGNVDVGPAFGEPGDGIVDFIDTGIRYYQRALAGPGPQTEAQTQVFNAQTYYIPNDGTWHSAGAFGNVYTVQLRLIEEDGNPVNWQQSGASGLIEIDVTPNISVSAIEILADFDGDGDYEESAGNFIPGEKFRLRYTVYNETVGAGAVQGRPIVYAPDWPIQTETILTSDPYIGADLDDDGFPELFGDETPDDFLIASELIRGDQARYVYINRETGEGDIASDFINLISVSVNDAGVPTPQFSTSTPEAGDGILDIGESMTFEYEYLTPGNLPSNTSYFAAVLVNSVQRVAEPWTELNKVVDNWQVSSALTPFTIDSPAYPDVKRVSAVEDPTSITSEATLQADATCEDAVISDDGKVVAFTSFATNLTPNVTLNGSVSQVLLYDGNTETHELVSLSVDGRPGNAHSSSADLSDDGRFVVFDSLASNLLLNGKDRNGTSDIYVRDRLINNTLRVNVSAAGVEANDESSWPSISHDGRFVVFQSRANNLDVNRVAGENPAQVFQVYVHDRLADGDVTRAFDQEGNIATHLVSRGNDTLIVGDGPIGTNTSRRPVISGDGQFIAFQTFAREILDNTIPGNEFANNHVLDPYTRSIGRIEQVVVMPNHKTSAGADPDVFSYPRPISNRKILVSANPVTGDWANRHAEFPDISEDGRFIAFATQSEILDARTADTNEVPDIYVYDQDRDGDGAFEAGNPDISFIDPSFTKIADPQEDLAPNTYKLNRVSLTGKIGAVRVQLDTFNDTLLTTGYEEPPVVTIDASGSGFDTIAIPYTDIERTGDASAIAVMGVDTVTLPDQGDTSNPDAPRYKFEPSVTIDNGFTTENSAGIPLDFRYGYTAQLSVSMELVTEDFGSGDETHFKITGINVVDPGYGYISEAAAYTVTITPHPNDTYARAQTQTTSVETLQILDVAMVDSGFGYFDVPGVEILGSDGATPLDLDISLREQAEDISSVPIGSTKPAISSDGRYVAFTSRAENLAPFPSFNNGTEDVYVVDRDNDNDGLYDELRDQVNLDYLLNDLIYPVETKVVSVNKFGYPTFQYNPDNLSSASRNASISGDGNSIAFESDTQSLGGLSYGRTNRVFLDTNDIRDIFVYDAKIRRTIDPIFNIKPTVAITSPTVAQSVPAFSALRLLATASDADGSVKQVQFYANGSPIGEPDTTYPYQSLFQPTVVGTAAITAVATDNEGAIKTSDVVIVEVIAANGVAPIVSIESPSTGDFYGLGESIDVTIESIGQSVVGIELYADGTLVDVLGNPEGGPTLAPPYEFLYTPSANGKITLEAVVYDVNLNNGISEQVVVGVGSGGGIIPEVDPLNSDTDFITQTYLDFFNRAPTTAELENGLNYLENGDRASFISNYTLNASFGSDLLLAIQTRYVALGEVGNRARTFADLATIRTDGYEQLILDVFQDNAFKDRYGDITQVTTVDEVFVPIFLNRQNMYPTGFQIETATQFAYAYGYDLVPLVSYFIDGNQRPIPYQGEQVIYGASNTYIETLARAAALVIALEDRQPSSKELTELMALPFSKQVERVLGSASYMARFPDGSDIYAKYLYENNITGADAGLDVNLDGDAYDNLQEYAFGLNPRVSNSALSVQRLKVVTVDGVDYLETSISYNPKAIDVVITAEEITPPIAGLIAPGAELETTYDANVGRIYVRIELDNIPADPADSAWVVQFNVAYEPASLL